MTADGCSTDLPLESVIRSCAVVFLMMSTVPRTTSRATGHGHRHRASAVHSAVPQPHHQTAVRVGMRQSFAT